MVKQLRVRFRRFGVNVAAGTTLLSPTRSAALMEAARAAARRALPRRCGFRVLALKHEHRRRVRRLPLSLYRLR